MTDKFSQVLTELEASGNFRKIPDEATGELVDLSSNDYMGIAADKKLLEEFNAQTPAGAFRFSSSASRLLSDRQTEFLALENLLASLYHKEALIFNSGYHCNTGVISALADKSALILADKLVHASIIDGIILSRAEFTRFRHNDLNHLRTLLEKNSGHYETILVVVESIYSMDGDLCNLQELVALKKEFPNVLLYVDEAHGFGVRGKFGLGIAEEYNVIPDIDILVGTLGKAAASAGAFVITNDILKKFLINKARSFIFSTALPPVSCLWSKFVVEKLTEMESRRKHLLETSEFLNEHFATYNKDIRSHSQIVPLIVGDSKKAVDLSVRLKNLGYQALPIRTPTVPKGTERIRFSLNADITTETAKKLLTDLKTIL